MTYDVAPCDTTPEQFLRLLCADNALLREEFDAIVTANFSEPAERDSAPPRRTPTRRGPGPIPSSAPTPGHRTTTPVDVPADFMARQRSPPR